METIINLAEKGMNHIGVWWVLAIGVLIGLFCMWWALSLRIAYLKEVCRDLKHENAYFAERDQMQTRIYDRLKTDLADKVVKHEFDKLYFAHDDDDVDDNEVIEPPPREKRKVAVRDPYNPNRVIFTEIEV